MVKWVTPSGPPKLADCNSELLSPPADRSACMPDMVQELHSNDAAKFLRTLMQFAFSLDYGEYREVFDDAGILLEGVKNLRGLLPMLPMIIDRLYVVLAARTAGLCCEFDHSLRRACCSHKE